MKPLLIAAAVAVATGLLFAGCTSATRFSIENGNAPGVRQNRFDVGEVPVIVVDPGQQESGATVRIIRTPDGSIVSQQAVVAMHFRGPDGADLRPLPRRDRPGSDDHGG